MQEDIEDNNGSPETPLDDYECQKCGEKLYPGQQTLVVSASGGTMG